MSSSRIPRISTRGYYDLTTGKTLKNDSYFLYPISTFRQLVGKKEIAIMIHGLMNDKSGALTKFYSAKERLCKLGYDFPVIGFSYDSNTTGAHIASQAFRALRIGQIIAKKNGRNLSQFIVDFKKNSPDTKIRLMGHSLGSQVILSCIERLSKKQSSNGIIESVHLFGSSITADSFNPSRFGKISQKVVSSKITNYYAPSDLILKYAHDSEQISFPIGYLGDNKKSISKYMQKKVNPENHRFASYCKTLLKFP